jgi:hypothetical protein
MSPSSFPVSAGSGLGYHLSGLQSLNPTRIDQYKYGNRSVYYFDPILGFVKFRY